MYIELFPIIRRDIYLFSGIPKHLHHFRGKVYHGPAIACHPKAGRVTQGATIRHTKVDDDGYFVSGGGSVANKVFRFDVSVDDAVFMEGVDGEDL